MFIKIIIILSVIPIIIAWIISKKMGSKARLSTTESSLTGEALIDKLNQASPAELNITANHWHLQFPVSNKKGNIPKNNLQSVLRKDLAYITFVHGYAQMLHTHPDAAIARMGMLKTSITLPAFGSLILLCLGLMLKLHFTWALSGFLLIIGISCALTLIGQHIDMQAARLGIKSMVDSRIFHRISEEEDIQELTKSHARNFAAPPLIKKLLQI